MAIDEFLKILDFPLLPLNNLFLILTLLTIRLHRQNTHLLIDHQAAFEGPVDLDVAQVMDALLNLFY